MSSRSTAGVSLTGLCCGSALIRSVSWLVGGAVRIRIEDLLSGFVTAGRSRIGAQQRVQEAAQFEQRFNRYQGRPERVSGTSGFIGNPRRDGTSRTVREVAVQQLSIVVGTTTVDLDLLTEAGMPAVMDSGARHFRSRM
jgi:hypothetical protein